MLQSDQPLQTSNPKPCNPFPVECIDAMFADGGLTKGKKYMVVAISKQYYTLQDDYNRIGEYLHSRFISVGIEPDPKGES